MKIRIYALLFVITALFTNTINAQDGANDPTFNPEDTGLGTGPDGILQCVAIQPDGKILVGGYFNHYNIIGKKGIARLNSDRTVDTSFNTDAIVTGNVLGITVQNDGKVIVSGECININEGVCSKLVRLNADGSIDPTFSEPELMSAGFVKGSVLQQDGKIIIYGAFFDTTFNYQKNILRLNANGSLDTSFNVGTGADAGIATAVIQTDGKIVIGGSFENFNGITVNRLARLLPDGSIDTGFVHNYLGNYLRSIALLPDGKMYLAGSGSAWSTGQPTVIRIQADGSTDTSFAFSQAYTEGTYNHVIVQADNKVVVVGQWVLRLNTDGAEDTYFQTGNMAHSPNIVANAAALQTDGKLVVVGSFLSYNGVSDNYIVRRNINGSRDNTFDNGYGTGADNTIHHIIKQQDKLIIAGDFNHYNGTIANRIARITAGGFIDTTFSSGWGPNGKIEFIKMTPDGKIVICGFFSAYNGASVNHLVRLNADGTLDTGFNMGGIGYDYNMPFAVYSMDVQDDGKILLSGELEYYNDIPIENMIRINTDGTLDTTFNTSFISDGTFAYKIINIPVEQKILVAASTISIATQDVIFKVDYNGMPDASFSTITSEWVRDVKHAEIRPDGKLWVYGLYVNAEQNFNVRLMRFNQDGTHDITVLDNSVMMDPLIWKILPQDDNKVVITGGFGIGYPGLSSTRIIRLNDDGSQDTAFDPGNSTFQEIFDVVPQADKLVIVGTFTSFDGTGRNRIARLFSSGTMGTNVPDAKSDKVIAYRNGDVLDVSSTAGDVTDVSVFSLDGKLIASQHGTSDSSVSIEGLSRNAIYIVKVRLSGNREVIKKIFY